ncbi:MAG TPA: phosphopentomutase [Clostridiales bacterium]|nr:phosphopentomutase [Clostridiales bacterium]
MKRIFLIILDSFGIGGLPDAYKFGDEGSNTLRSVYTSEYLDLPNMTRLGLYNIDGVEVGDKSQDLIASYARMIEQSTGKDTTIGHWEIAGIISHKPLPTFPEGFPKELLDELSKRTGRGMLCNKPYSGTEVIKDYGQEHIKTGDLIVYTSADSVLQIAAHEDVVATEELYEYCEIARELCVGDWGVGRIIARPFEGKFPDFNRTSRRHDFSLQPPKITMLDTLKDNDYSIIAIGKINDIFVGRGITSSRKTSNNAEGIEVTIEYLDKDFEGICFVNLVDFDMLYGHRNDIDGYAKALTYFDNQLPRIMEKLKKDDVLIIAADHGCDPGTESTDHSREYIPLLVYGDNIKAGVNLGTRNSFADIGSSILDYFDLKDELDGESFLDKVM